MHALKPSPPNLYPVEPKRRAPRARTQVRSHPHRAIAAEVSAKLIVNGVLAIAAGVALIKLLPYNLSQQSKLQELQTEVASTEAKVDQLRQEFNRQFDPQQARQNMAEITGRHERGQSQVIFIEPEGSETTPGTDTTSQIQ